MSDSNKLGVTVMLVGGEISRSVYFLSDYLWEVDDNGNLIIVKEYGKDWKIATFASVTWQYIRQI